MQHSTQKQFPYQVLRLPASVRSSLESLRAWVFLRTSFQTRAKLLSTLLEDVYRVLQIKRIRTSPLPSTDSLVECFNGMLKAMLKKFVNQSQKDWNEYLPYLLFAYHKVPQELTGFSPFELFGQRVRATGCLERDID